MRAATRRSPTLASRSARRASLPVPMFEAVRLSYVVPCGMRSRQSSRPVVDLARNLPPTDVRLEMLAEAVSIIRERVAVRRRARGCRCEARFSRGLVR